MDLTSKIARHNETLRTAHPAVVFCAACGSACVDQNSVSELKCYDCGNTAPWDASRFGVRRGLGQAGARDVLAHLSRLPRTAARARGIGGGR